jgi:hypothetical protein
MLWRIRFKLRFLMIVVAIVAVAIWAELTRRQWVSDRHMAAFYGKREEINLRNVEIAETEVARLRRAAEDLREADKGLSGVSTSSKRRADEMINEAVEFSRMAESLRRQAVRDGKLKDRYRRAASSLWQSVEPE